MSLRQREVLRDYIAERTGQHPNDFLPHVLADTLVAARESAAWVWSRSQDQRRGEDQQTPLPEYLGQAIVPVLHGFLGQ